MDSRTTRYFAALAQHNSMRDAAAALHIAQSALSRQIAKIEHHYGTALFDRHARGVVLTEAGEVYLRYARDQMAQDDHMRAELDVLKGVHHGTLRIHTIESLARSMLPPLLAVFRDTHPGVRFQVTIAGSDEIIGAVRDVATDIGIGYYSQPSPEIEIRALMREPLMALISSKHPLAKSKQITLRDAAQFPIALTGKNSRSRHLIDTACWQAGVSLSPMLETNSVELLTGFVEHSEGVTFLLRLSARDGIRARRIVAVPVRSEVLNMGAIEALSRASRKLPPSGEEFLTFLSSHLSALWEQQSRRRVKHL